MRWTPQIEAERNVFETAVAAAVHLEDLISLHEEGHSQVQGNLSLEPLEILSMELSGLILDQATLIYRLGHGLVSRNELTVEGEEESG